MALYQSKIDRVKFANKIRSVIAVKFCY